MLGSGNKTLVDARIPRLGPRSRYVFILLAILGVLCSPRLAAQEPAANKVTVRTVREDAVGGLVAAFSFEDGLTLQVGQSKRRVIELRDLVRVSTGLRMTRPRASEGVLRLAGGDFLYGRPAETVEGVVSLETPGLGTVRVPLDTIASWEPPAFHLNGGASRWKAVLDNQPLDEDVVLLSNGDVARGFVAAIDQTGVTLERDAEQTVISTELVAAVRLVEPAPTALDRPYVVLQLADSGRLTVTDLNWSGGSIQVKPRFGSPLRINPDRVVRVDVFGGRWERLPTRRPISDTHTPMLALSWPYQTNRNVRGGPLVVAGERFEHGIGVHSRSSLTYALDEDAEEFVTSFGMDDDSGPLADVDVSILVDGSPRYQAKHVRRGRLHGPVRIDVKQAKQLELIVDFSANGDVQDRFNWIAPALIRR